MNKSRRGWRCWLGGTRVWLLMEKQKGLVASTGSGHLPLPGHPAGRRAQLPLELALGSGVEPRFCFCKLGSHFDFFDCKKNPTKQKKTKTKRNNKCNQTKPKATDPLPPSSCSELCTWLVKMMTEACCLLFFLVYACRFLLGGAELQGPSLGWLAPSTTAQ